MNQSKPMKIATISRHPASYQKLILAIVIGSSAAILANVIYYFILKNFLGINFIAPEQNPPPQVSPLPVADVIIFSAIFSIGATLVFLIIANIVRKPALVFFAISIIVLVVSLFFPLKIPTPPIPMSTKYALASMHILGAVIIIPILIFIGLPKRVYGDGSE